MNEDFTHIFGAVFDDCRINCPECGDSRKKNNQKTLSVTVDGSDYIIAIIVIYQAVGSVLN